MKLIPLILLCLFTTLGVNPTFAQDDHGETCQAGTPVELNTTTPGDLAANDHDFFQITLPAPDALRSLGKLGIQGAADLAQKHDDDDRS